MDTYSAERELDTEFMQRVCGWIADFGDVLVVLRYLRAAGRKDFVFCRTAEEFARIVDWAPRGTDIEVHRDRQLPIRGVANEELVQRALAVIRNGQEYLVLDVDTALTDMSGTVWSMGESHEELFEDLGELAGRSVAVGIVPNYIAQDNEDLISRSKGGIDGPR